MDRIKTFREFYIFYLSEHSNKTCRLLHFIGTTLVFLFAFLAVYLNKPVLWIFVPIAGYGFAWVGHFIFEKNRPATFIYPLYSLIGDWVMFKDMLAGKIKF